MERKPWNWLSFVAGLAGALVVLGGIWAGLAINQARVDAESEAYVRCMEGLGFPQDTDPSTVDFELLAAAAVVCSDR